MGKKYINKCRVCKSRELKYALKIKEWVFVFCKNCTLLQRQDDILYQINFNFEGRQFELDYYPAFLSNNQLDCVNGNSCIFFSLKAIEYLLYMSGYKIIDAKIIGTKLYVAFDKLNQVQMIERNEQKLQLDNYFSYFLWAIKLKQ